MRGVSPRPHWLPNLTVARLCDLLLHELPKDRIDTSAGQAGRVLDSQIEAQVHGPIDLRIDVELIVADPAYAADATLRQLSRTYSIPLHWHVGFRLAVRDVPDDFRGHCNATTG